MAIKTKTRSGGKTAAGGAILNLAIGLMKKDGTLTLEDAKEQVKQNIKEKRETEKKQSKLSEALELGIGGKYKRAVLRGLLGRGIGDKVSGAIRSKSQDERNAVALRDLDHVKNPYGDNDDEGQVGTFKRIRNPKDSVKKDNQFSMIMKKLNKIDADIKTIKLVKIQPPPKDTKEEKSPHHEDAALGLKALGYKKTEIDEMLKNAKGATAQDIIKDALKPKNAEKIPTAQVPAAVDAVNVTPAVVPDQQQDQAAKVKTANDAAEKEMADEKQRKEMKKELDDIKDKVSHGSILSTLLAGLSTILAPFLSLLPMIGTALAAIAPLLGGLLAIAGAAYAGYKIGQWLNDKFHLSDKAVAGVEKVQGVLGFDTPEAAGKRATRTITFAESAARTNKKLEGTGYTLTNTNEYTDASGKKMKSADLPANIQAKIGLGNVAAANKSPDSTAAAAIAAPAASAAAAQKIDAASSQNSQMKAESAVAPTVIQNIDNSTKVAPSSGGGGGSSPSITIAVRNMESSVGNYIGTIFNHPSVRLPM
jgi:RuvA, C-terminal domain